MESQPDVCGWLLKKGEKGMIKSYKKRWFRVSQGKMLYFETDASDSAPLGEIDLASVTSVGTAVNDSSTDLLGFDVVTPARIYKLRAQSAAELNMWLQHLRTALEESGKRQDVQENFELWDPNRSGFVTVDLDDKEDDTEDERNSSPLHVHVLDSQPLSSTLLNVESESEEIIQSRRVIDCLKSFVGPPARPQVGPVGPLLRALSQDQINWLAPLLLALERPDVTEIFLHLVATGSPQLRFYLICLHSCGFTHTFARASINSLFDITTNERNTLGMINWINMRDEKIIVGQQAQAEMVHPFSNDPVDGLVVKKVFSTAAKPMLVEFHKGDQPVMPMVITKDGDNLCVDMKVQIMFRVFNALWITHAHQFIEGQLPYAKTYRVCPFTSRAGVIEVVPNCKSLAEYNWEYIDRFRTCSSAIGAFVAGFVLGVRDRHEDNILFSMDTKELFHVDFGYIFNSQTKMFDAPRFAIPSTFKRILVEKNMWENHFVENAVIAYNILRQNKDFVVKLCETLFSDTNETCGQYLRTEAFMDNQTDEFALKRIKYLVEKGPRSWKRLAKNITHILGF